MPRERWFFVQRNQRKGPFSLDSVVEYLRGESDPRALLVWRRGLPGWTRAGDVPEIAARFDPGELPPRGVPVEPQPLPREPRLARSRLPVAAGFLVLLAAGSAALYSLRVSQPRADPLSPPATTFARVSPPPLSGASVASPPDSERSSAEIRAEPVSTTLQSPRGIAASEAELPAAELGRLRGVAAWSGDALELTLYNGTEWRLTELRLRIERFSEGEFVEDERPLLLLPRPQRVDAGVADLLERVAPDRRKPGLNSLDTGVFSARAGPAPEGYRWRIDSAHGYRPLR